MALAAAVGCGTDTTSFARKADQRCDAAMQALANIPTPTTAAQGIDYALTYYTTYDYALGELAKMRRPAAESAQIEARWIGPAQQSLQAFHANLRVIRQAGLRGDAAEVNEELAELRKATSRGVRSSYIASIGASACARMFSSAGDR